MNTFTIAECCDILDSRRIPLNKQQRQKFQGKIPYYGANGVQGYINDYIFDEDLILIAEDGGNFEQYATRSIAYKISGKSWVNNHAHILRAKKGFNQDAIFYSLVNKNILNFISGGTRSKLNQSELRAITITLPDYKEQSKIAEILSTIDRAISQTEALIAKHQRIKTGLMQDLLTRGIDEHGQLRDESTHKFKSTPLGMIPVEWEVALMDHVAKRGSGHTPNKSKPEYWNGGIKWISLADSDKLDKVYIYETDKNISELGIENSSAVKHPHGTVVISRDAGIGKSAITTDTMAVSQHFIAWVCGNKLDNHYLYYWLQFKKADFEAAGFGTTIKTIGLLFFKKLQIILPPKDEQEKISKILLKEEKQIVQLNENLAKLHKVKTGLMQDLLSGEVSVTPLLEN